MGARPKNYLSSHGYRIYNKQYEHRTIASRVLGRPLKKHEEVHHVDGATANNAHRNLIICTRAFHKYLHFMDRVRARGVTRKDLIQWHCADGVPLETIKRHLHLGEGMIGRWFKRMNIPITPGVSGRGSLKYKGVWMDLNKY